MLKSFSALTAAAVLGLAAVGISATPGDAKNSHASTASRLRCEAVAGTETSLSARHESRVQHKGPRTKFHVAFETTTTDGFAAGQSVAFSVDTVVVGTVVLASVDGTLLETAVGFDSKARAGTKRAFPAGFPAVAAGSVVEASVDGTVVLGCVLASS